MKNLFTLLITILIYQGATAQKMPPSIEDTKREPIIYTGGLSPDASRFDGKLPHAIGVHSFQAMRANREFPSEQGVDKGWTYNHQPYLAYWNNQFYLQYLSGEYQEHTPPTRIMLMTSKEGIDWTAPKTLFPVYDLPEIKRKDVTVPAGTKAVMHQRMGFYVAPNGKLLALGFYSYCITPKHSPNAGQGLGRVVREVKQDGSFGPIYFIRYNRHVGFNESNTNFPFYKKSKDKEFLAACEALLKDKLITLQWWEEDRAKDGFYVVDPGDAKGAAYFSETITTSAGAGKAFCYYHRHDGVVVGIWKNQWSALSADEGRTWTPFTRNKSINPTGAKVWAQRLDDGTFALVHNQTAGFRNRYPMVLMHSPNGHEFDKMLVVNGEVPIRRYQGLHKRMGTQYYRGIIEGNGNPPEEDLWVTYSVNKEDIWVSKITVPIIDEVTENIDENFEAIAHIDQLKYWNLYVPQWASSQIISDATTGNQYLQMKDEAPYDYAKVERIFPKSKKVEISFDLQTISNRRGYALEIEVQDQRSSRPLRLRIDDLWLMFERHSVRAHPIPYQMNEWHSIKLIIDTDQQAYDAYYNQELVRKAIPFAEKVDALERLVIRTGPYRGMTDRILSTIGQPADGGLRIEDLPASGIKTKANIYNIDNVKITKLK